jgi:hypothetical protein
MGIVNAVVPAAELRGAVMGVATTVAAAGHDAVLLSKQVVRHGAADLRKASPRGCRQRPLLPLGGFLASSAFRNRAPAAGAPAEGRSA